MDAVKNAVGYLKTEFEERCDRWNVDPKTVILTGIAIKLILFVVVDYAAFRAFTGAHIAGAQAADMAAKPLINHANFPAQFGLKDGMWGYYKVS